MRGGCDAQAKDAAIISYGRKNECRSFEPAGISPPGDVPEDRRLPLDPSLFNYATLNRVGK